jgi:hypothetical protein
MAALRFNFKCSRTNVYAPLQNQIDALPLNVIYNFEIAFGQLFQIKEMNS